MIRNILLAYDGSESAEHAFGYARLFGRKLGARLMAVSVVQRPRIGDDVETTAALDQGLTQAESLFRGLRYRASQDEIEIDCSLRVGRVAETLLEEANRNAADLIVLGHHGISLIERWVVGSTAGRVMAGSRCPILLVR